MSADADWAKWETEADTADRMLLELWRTIQVCGLYEDETRAIVEACQDLPILRDAFRVRE